MQVCLTKGLSQSLGRTQEWLALVTSTHIGFQSRDRLLGRFRRANRVRTNCGRDDECLCVMNCQRLESIRRALHDCGISFYKIQNLQVTSSVMMHRNCEPVPSCLNEFERVQSGPLLAPSITRCHNFILINEIFAHPVSRPIPLDVLQSVLQVNWPWSAIQTQPSPVPKLEGEDIWCGTYLQHHEVTPGTVNRACR